MYYFYAMQKSLQQLDLFGMPVEPVSPPAKKKPVVKEKTAEPLPVVAEPEPEILPAPTIEAIVPVTDPVVFADERIVVKIKAKAPTPVIVEKKQPEELGRKTGKGFYDYSR